MEKGEAGAIFHLAFWNFILNWVYYMINDYITANLINIFYISEQTPSPDEFLPAPMN